jgi:photosystem II stability/assembly factor-like uncharacterized protein
MFASYAVLLLAFASDALGQRSEPYHWRNVVIGGGGFVTGIITHPARKGLIYARTDVGGAYRWDDQSHHWIPLTDWVGASEANLTGIESIAVDPSDPERVYLAAGTYQWGDAAVLRSQDRGNTFQKTKVPFRMGANETGRFNGERLAVDPNQDGILFFGSRMDGLWKSQDRGETWKKVETFPEIDATPGSGGSTSSWSRFGQQAVGIVAVVFDAASGKSSAPTPDIYVAVSTPETNLFRTTNGGATWLPVAGQPIGFRPNHLLLAPNHELYATYGKESGPNTMTDGAVWKYALQSFKWTDITPLKPAQANQPFGYGAIAIDPHHPDTVMTATFAHWKPMDEIFRSTNGGLSWMPLLQKAVWDHSTAPYTERHRPHWIGDLEIDPFNSDHVLFVTGYGIWSCSNATEAESDNSTRWSFLDDGLEETVPLVLASPPQGASLLSGVGDIDGFRHDDLTASPRQSFSGPRFANTEDLAFAGRNPKVIARCGTGKDAPVHAALSVNGGQDWTALESEPPGSRGAGKLTISADGGTIVWTPQRSAPCFTTDQGRSWTPCSGLSLGTRVVADMVNPAKFYAFEPQPGQLFASTNGARSFLPTGAQLPAAEGGNHFNPRAGAIVSSAPDAEGDLWFAWHGQGLYHSTDSGKTFVKIRQVLQANAFGFGKAAQGAAFPSVYLAGKVGKVEGLFRSNDGGENWVRINDSRHQFGSITHLTGDPRVFGRVYLATNGRGIIYGEPVRDKAVVTTSGPGDAAPSRVQ